jgi:hypothetical protein
MRRSTLRYLRNETIERLTADRIREYEQKTGELIRFPVPVENIVEQVLGLDFDWDEIEEQPGELILGGLDATNKTILLNEKHLPLFEEKLGLERSTIGHEAGHWDLDVDRASPDQLSLFGEKETALVYRHASKTDRVIEVLLAKAYQDERAYRLYKQLTAGQDTPEQRSAVDRYQSALLMPAWLIREAVERYDVTNWPDLYRLTEEALVSISNLVTRLHRLKLIFIPKGSKRIYRSEEEYNGQGLLF